jgi:hypothetical protein
MILPLLLIVDFMNFNYTVSPCSNVPPPMIMRKGTYSYFDKKMGTGFDVFVRGVKIGSLRSGTQQAVVVLSCDFPVGGTAEAFAYDIRGNTAVPLGQVGGANWGGDWGKGPDSIHITFKNDLLYVDSCKDDQCATREVRTYALREGKLVKVYVQTHKTNDP